MKAIFSQADLRAEFLSQDFGLLKIDLEKKFEKEGMVVCQFKLNGLQLTEKQEKEFSVVRIEEIEEIEVLVQAPDQLLPAVIESWLEELPSLIVKVDGLSKKIKFDGPEGHLKDFVDLVDSCQYLIECLVALEKVVIKDPETKVLWSKNSSQITETIGQLLNAFEKKDFVLLSEILEYDLAHGLQRWNDTLGRIHAGVCETRTNETSVNGSGGESGSEPESREESPFPNLESNKAKL